MSTGEQPIVEFRAVRKTFHGVHALEGVSFAVEAGTVHALVGENGAGKSTLMKILTGVHHPDAGQILLNGSAVQFAGPRDARAAGIDIVFQEIELPANLCVAEAIFLGREPVRWGQVRYRSMFEQAQRVIEQIGVPLGSATPIEQLSVAQKQVVQIARALAAEARVLIMDEPTSALTEHEIERLFVVLTDLRRRGVTVLYVSHKLEEIFRLADRLTVLRDGRHVATVGLEGLSEVGLIRMMTGRSETEAEEQAGRPAPLDREEEEPSGRDARAPSPGEEAGASAPSRRPRLGGLSSPARPAPRLGGLSSPARHAPSRSEEAGASARTPSRGGDRDPALLRVEDLTGEPWFRRISFELHAGEVLGLFGIVGAGRSELARAIFGLDPHQFGRVLLEGRELVPDDPRAAVDAGLALVPEDRKGAGLVAGLSVRQNASLAALRRLSRWGVIDTRAEQRTLATAAARMRLSPASFEHPVRDLSGGNQQKVVIAKWLATAPRLLILDEPTKGIDIGSKREIHAFIRELRALGLGVLLISSELSEVLALADRVLVLREGDLAAELDPARTTREQLLSAAVGGTSTPDSSAIIPVDERRDP